MNDFWTCLPGTNCWRSSFPAEAEADGNGFAAGLAVPGPSAAWLEARPWYLNSSCFVAAFLFCRRDFRRQSLWYVGMADSVCAKLFWAGYTSSLAAWRRLQDQGNGRYSPGTGAA